MLTRMQNNSNFALLVVGIKSGTVILENGLVVYFKS